MLNAFLIQFDGWFPLGGAVAVAFFSLYLLACAVKGCFKFGMRFLLVNLHPMKYNATYMNSFLFNAALISLCAFPVAQFSTQVPGRAPGPAPLGLLCLPPMVDS